MEIKVFADYEFCDISDCCPENGTLYIKYPVPKAWAKWSEEKKEEWFQKNNDKIWQVFQDVMCVAPPKYFLDEGDY